jgi:hypothetical protein
VAELALHPPLLLVLLPQPILAPASAAELISPPHIEIIDPPNKLRQEIKTKNNPGTRHGNEFGATLTSCGDLTPLICFGQFAADPHSRLFFRPGPVAVAVDLISTNKQIKKLRNKNEQPKILLLLLLLSDLPQIFPLSSSSAHPHDPIFIDSIAIHFRIFCHHISLKLISILHCDESLQ